MIIDNHSSSGERELGVGTSWPVGWRAWVKQYHLDILIPGISLAVAAILFAASISRIDLSKINDLGLIAALPVTVFVAGLILTASFLFCLSQPTLRTPLILLHLLALIILLSGIPPLVEQVPRFNVTWRHAGIVEAITRLGQIDPTIDAYFNWPGFFLLSGLVVKVTGLPSALSLAPWSPVFYGFLYLGSLIMIFDTATRDRRLVWLGIWVFYLANWIGQDYFSPQGLNIFLYLVLLGILLKWFRVGGKESAERRDFHRLGRLAQPVRRIFKWMAADEAFTVSETSAAKSGLMAIWLLVFALIVSSHQLTPFAVFISVTALVLLRRVSPRYLPIVMGVMILAWLYFMAGAYMRGHLTDLLAQIGQFGDTVNRTVTSRVIGSPGHNLVVRASFAMTLAVWGLALLGIIRRMRNGRRDSTFTILAIAPFVMLGLQSYGGEMLLRVYLLSLPFMAFFAAGIVFPAPQSAPSWRTITAAGLVGFVLLGGFFLTRYGNEKMDMFTQAEVDAYQTLYNVAPPGAEIAASSPKDPAKFEKYEQYSVIYMPDEAAAGDVPAIISRMEHKPAPARYLILTRSQAAYLQLYYGMSSETWDQLLKSLQASPRFELIYSNQDAQIFLLLSR